MVKYNYFDSPMQVRFWNDTDGDYLGGIAYRDEIICGKCGGIFAIAEVQEDAELANKQAIFPLNWISLSEGILGEK